MLVGMFLGGLLLLLWGFCAEFGFIDREFLLFGAGETGPRERERPLTSIAIPEHRAGLIHQLSQRQPLLAGVQHPLQHEDQLKRGFVAVILLRDFLEEF